MPNIDPPALMHESARLAWAQARLSEGDPLAGYIVDALQDRAWRRAGRQGAIPERAGPTPDEARALTAQLESAVLTLQSEDGLALVDAAEVHGGLVESVTTDASRFLAHADRLRQRIPLRHLRLVGPPGALLSSPALAGLAALDLSRVPLDEAACRALARNPAAQSLRWLALPPVGEAAITQLAASPWLLGLERGLLASPPAPEKLAELEIVHGPRPWLRSGDADWDLVEEQPSPRTPQRLRFRELRHTGPGPDAPSIAENVRSEGEPDEAAMVEYLAKAPVLVVSPGRVRDVLDPEKRAGSASLRTDGVYAWSEDLAHYVRRWHLRVPDGLLQHGRAVGWEVPAGLDLRGLR